jgi:tetratricopeptide (TPR) repeat protein
MEAGWLSVAITIEVRRTCQVPTTFAGGSQSFWQRVYKSPLILPVLFLLLIYIISTAMSVVPKVSFWGSYARLQGTYTTFSYILLFFMTIQGLKTRRQLNRLITVMILVSFPIAMYGIIQHFGLDPLWGLKVKKRASSTMGNPIFLAAYLIMVVPLTLSQVLKNWKEAIGPFDIQEGTVGMVTSVLPAGGLLAGILIGGNSYLEFRWIGLLIGIALQIPVYLIIPVKRLARVLTISLPLSFAFLLGFSWMLEIFFPPPNPTYLWMGLLVSFIFLLTMVISSHYLKRPVSLFLLLAGYFVILITQVTCIFYTQSRGPFLGLLGGIFFYLVFLGFLKRRVWISWLLNGLAVTVIIFLIIFNTSDSPFIKNLREIPYVGRFGTISTTESTGKVRILIWEGVVKLINWHEPLKYPGEEGGPDGFNALRPLIGYGPESMNVVYNRFYPPDLAHLERRGAFPDRSHNETLDMLVITGVIGFLVYIFLFTSIFYYGLKWLGLIGKPWQRLAFLGLWLGGGFMGGIFALLLYDPLYVGVGIPGGLLTGLAFYVFVLILLDSWDPRRGKDTGGLSSLWMLALFSGIVAHFIEIQIGIAIAATRTYFWIYAALMVVIGTRFLSKPGEDKLTRSTSKSLSGEEKMEAALASQYQPSLESKTGWRGSSLVLGMLATLILSTILFFWKNIPVELFAIWNSLTQNQGKILLSILTFIISTWLMIGIIGLSELACQEESKEKKVREWLAGAGIYTLVSFTGTILFVILHAFFLKAMTIKNPDTLANPIIFYYLFLFLVVFSLAFSFSFRFSWRTRPWGLSGKLGDIGVITLAVILSVMAIILINTTNISIIRADTFYNKGLSLEKGKKWDAAIFFYNKAIATTKNQNFYYLALARAYMAKAKEGKKEEQEKWLKETKRILLKAREILPLNTDSSASLALLYRTWGEMSKGELKTKRLKKALAYWGDAINLSPHNVQLLNMQGQLHFTLGDYKRAREIYQKSLKLDCEYDKTFLLLGRLYIKQKKWNKAVEVYHQGIKINPKEAKFYSGLGFVYPKTGKIDEAIKTYLKALELKPKNFNNHKNLAVLYQQMGRTDEAVSEATEALKFVPQSQKQVIKKFLTQLRQQLPAPSLKDAQRVQHLIAEGLKQMKAEEWDVAEKTYKQVLELNPNNTDAHSSLAHIYSRLCRMEEAVSECLTMAVLLPNDYKIYKNLAMLYLQKGEIAKAISETREALTLAPEKKKKSLEAFLHQLEQAQGVISGP